jgi:hypothetical protein
MSNEDYSRTTVTRIASDFTRLENNWGWPRPESDWGITRDRWDEYRELFMVAKLRNGIDRSNAAATDEVYFPIWGQGLADNSHEVGIVFAPHPPSNMKGESLVIEYKPISDDWYSYDWQTW